MTLPHAFYFNSRFAALWQRATACQGVTFYFWTFFSVPNDAQFDRSYLAHERAHSPQWLRWSLVAAVLVLVLTHSPLFAALGFLGGFPVRYESEMLVRAACYRSWKRAYDKHSLEQQARRIAGQALR